MSVSNCCIAVEILAWLL